MTAADLQRHLAPLRAQLFAHPLYARVADAGALRTFMRTHAFAVWDFMALLKSLQRGLTCVEVPWHPPARRAAARFVNEIVLAEESDEVAPGRHASHFELYLAAMDEAGADARPVRALVAAIARGVPASEALAARDVPPAAARFVRTTLELAGRPLPAVAAAFLFGREDPIPAMFRRLLDSLPPDARARHPDFCRYLERHEQLDGEQHGPLGRRLLDELCGGDETSWRTALAAAESAIRARIELWDAIAGDLTASLPPRAVATAAAAAASRASTATLDRATPIGAAAPDASATSAPPPPARPTRVRPAARPPGSDRDGSARRR